MTEQITVTCRPRQMVYTSSSAYTFTSKSWDNNLTTYDLNDTGAPATLLLDLSAVPKNALIKKVKYRLYLYRTDNASYCGLQMAMGYADSLTGGINSQHRVTDYKDIGLSAYKKNEETSAEQSITAAQSAQIISAQYPVVWMNTYGSMRYYEISVDVTYEIPQNEMYVGDVKAAEVYVGNTKATAVYAGINKIL